MIQIINKVCDRLNISRVESLAFSNPLKCPSYKSKVGWLKLINTRDHSHPDLCYSLNKYSFWIPNDDRSMTFELNKIDQSNDNRFFVSTERCRSNQMETLMSELQDTKNQLKTANDQLQQQQQQANNIKAQLIDQHRKLTDQHQINTQELQNKLQDALNQIKQLNQTIINLETRAKRLQVNKSESTQYLISDCITDTSPTITSNSTDTSKFIQTDNVIYKPTTSLFSSEIDQNETIKCNRCYTDVKYVEYPQHRRSACNDLFSICPSCQQPINYTDENSIKFHIRDCEKTNAALKFFLSEYCICYTEFSNLQRKDMRSFQPCGHIVCNKCCRKITQQSDLRYYRNINEQTKLDKQDSREINRPTTQLFGPPVPHQIKKVVINNVTTKRCPKCNDEKYLSKIHF